MAKGKSQYVINFSADPQLVNQTVCNWLNENGFKYMEKYDCKFYRKGDGIWTTSRCFEYYIQGNQLTILAYLKTPKNPFSLNSGVVGAANTAPYLSLLSTLTDKINSLPPANMQYDGGYANNQYYQQPINGQTGSDLKASAEKGAMAGSIVGICIGLLNILLGFAGYQLGVIWIILGLVFAISGLKSDNKILGISAVAIMVISIIVYIMLMTGFLTL